MSKTCECGKSIKENYKMCYNCSKNRSVEKVNIELQNKKITFEYKKDKTLPTLTELSEKDKKIKEGDKYRCSYSTCDNILTAGKKCDEQFYFYCYHCYLKSLKDNYKPKKNIYDDDDFIDD
jgi:hypothetical protein